MLSAASIALSGMGFAQLQLQASAHNIANFGTPDFRRQQVEPAAMASGGVGSALTQSPRAGDSLETDMVGLLTAKNSFLANLAVFKASDSMRGALLDIQA